MAKAINELREKHGWVKFEGKTYTLLRDAYADDDRGDPIYRVFAICEEDGTDELGCYPVYDVVWDVLDEYIAACEEDPFAYVDEALACDWENPRDVRDSAGYGSYDPDNDRIF